MERLSNKIIPLLVAVIAMTLLPFQYINLKYLFQVSLNPVMAVMVGIGYLIWVGLSIAVIYALLSKKAWSFCLVWSVWFFSVLIFLKQIVMFGTYGAGENIGVSLIIFLVVLYLVCNKNMRARFSIEAKQIKVEKITAGIALFCILGIIAFYGFIIQSRINRFARAFQKPVVVFIAKDKYVFAEADYSLEPAFGWTIPVPKEASLKDDRSDAADDLNKRITFSNKNKTIFMMIGTKTPLLTLEWSKISRFMNIKNDYDLLRKIHYERVGLIFLMLKTLTTMNDAVVYDVRTHNLKGFLQKVSKQKADVKVYEYVLFDNQNNQIDITFISRANALSESQIKGIIASIKFSG